MATANPVSIQPKASRRHFVPKVPSCTSADRARSPSTKWVRCGGEYLGRPARIRAGDQDKSAVRRILDQAKAAGRDALTAPEARGVCEAYGIVIPKEGVAKTADEAAALAASIGFPAVMKIVSPQILHETEAGGVIVGFQEVKLSAPLVVRVKGTNEDIGKQQLKASGLPIISADNMADAAQKIVAAVNAA
jgi:acyl-CoA synthetase (NDP forming)